MYVLIVNRVVKHNTGSHEKFAPRSANREELHVTGPYRTFRSAESAEADGMVMISCLSMRTEKRLSGCDRSGQPEGSGRAEKAT